MAADDTGQPQTTGERVFCSVLIACVPSLLLGLAAYTAGPGFAVLVFGGSLIAVSILTYKYMAPAEINHALEAEGELIHDGTKATANREPRAVSDYDEMQATTDHVAEWDYDEMQATTEHVAEWDHDQTPGTVDHEAGGPARAHANGSSQEPPIEVIPLADPSQLTTRQRGAASGNNEVVATTGAGTPRGCEQCGSDFLPVRANMKYCSPACRIEAAKQRRRTAGAERDERNSTPVPMLEAEGESIGDGTKATANREPRAVSDYDEMPATTEHVAEWDYDEMHATTEHAAEWDHDETPATGDHEPGQPARAHVNGSSQAPPMAVSPLAAQSQLGTGHEGGAAPATHDGAVTPRAGTWRVCKQCGSDFLPRRANMKYCSTVCRIDAASDRRRTAGAEREARGSTPVSTRI